MFSIPLSRVHTKVGSYVVKAVGLYWLFVKRFKKTLFLTSLFVIITLHTLQISPSSKKINDQLSTFSHKVQQQVKSSPYVNKYFPSVSETPLNQTQLQTLLASPDVLVSLAYRKIANSDIFEAAFSGTDLAERCTAYFDAVHELDPDWKVAAIGIDSHGYNRDFLDLKSYQEMRMARYRDEFYEQEKDKHIDSTKDQLTNDRALRRFKNLIVVPENKLKDFASDFEKSIDNNSQIEQSILDGLTSLRIFGKCYIQNNIESSNDVEKRLFPWLTGKYPVFTNSDGSKTFTNELPDLSSMFKFEKPNLKNLIGMDSENFYVTNNTVGYQYNETQIKLPTKEQKEKHQKGQEAKDKADKAKLADAEANMVEHSATYDSLFVSSLKNKFRGKGIAMTASDNQVNDLLNLIKILRALNNKLPIQIIHKGDLSKASQDKIVRVARDKIEVPYSYHKVSSILSNEFAKQDIWFVDVSPCISPDYFKYFTKYANKLLATFFNSFEEMILVDTDVIPFVNLEDLFNAGHYKNLGTYFFKDREMYEEQKAGDAEFFIKLMPSKADELLFGIPPVTNKTLENRYLKLHFVHLMESGVVVLNKVQHFLGVITMMQLQLYEPSATRVWGDKELFWLGLSISGDENYEFNRDSAYAIGERSEEKYRFSKSSKFLQEVCSSHPGHLNEAGELLWINSGFKNCKNLATYEMDSRSYKWRKFFQLGRAESVKLQKKLKYYYNLPTRITHAILPSVDVRKYERNIRVNDNDRYIVRTWKKRAECMGYLWCGYLSKDEHAIDEKALPQEFHGRVVEFNNITSLIGEYLGDLWISNYVEGYRLPDEIEVEGDEVAPDANLDEE